MATIKAFTDLEQSKVLAEILPLESADMCCFENQDGSCNYYGFPYTQANKAANPIPLWSLAALLNVLPNYHLQTQDNGVGIMCSCKKGHMQIIEASNLVDACYELILKLSTVKLL